jgi:transcriptional regulator with XRE-family HTH domain
MTVADRVRELREAKKWSQAQLAAAVTKLGGKLSQQNVANIEAGIVKQPKSLLHLATALGVSPMWLDTGLGKREPSSTETQTKPAPNIFLSHSGQELPKAMIDLLVKMPEGSPEEKAVIGMIRHLKKAGDI